MVGLQAPAQKSSTPGALTQIFLSQTKAIPDTNNGTDKAKPLDMFLTQKQTSFSHLSHALPMPQHEIWKRQEQAHLSLGEERIAQMSWGGKLHQRPGNIALDLEW